MLLAYLRGLLGPEYQKQGIRSALRQELVLQSLDVELAGKELLDGVVMQATIITAPGLKFDAGTVERFSTDLGEQLREAHRLIGGEIARSVQLASKTLSREAMVALYQAMLDARVIKKPQ